MSTIVVAGAIANKCRNGGEAWVRLSWALGFRRLGCRVLLVEQIRPEACVDAAGRVTPFPTSENAAYFREVTQAFGFEASASLLLDAGEGDRDAARTPPGTGHSNGDADQAVGLTRAELLDRVADADLLVNISGHMTDDSILRAVRRSAYVDIDPGFTQFWADARVPGGKIAPHDVYFTIGENIGSSDCTIPTAGFAWRATRQPVVLEEWPMVNGGFDRFTTISSWRGPFGAVEHPGGRYPLKHHQFRRFISLPRRVRAGFELALAIHPHDGRDLSALHANGWRTVDPVGVVGEPGSFRSYVQTSGAEFSPAQGVYVDTGSGWFSDRTTRYLASGKPVLIQDTGFTRNLPAREGLVAFRTLDEAVAGAESITRDYPAHAAAARSVAEDYFDSDRVLSRFLEEAGVGG